MRAAIVRERGTIGAVLARTRRYPPATRAAHAEALVCWAAGGAALMLTMATSAVRDTVTRCTPGTVVGGVNAVVRLPGTSVGGASAQ